MQRFSVVTLVALACASCADFENPPVTAEPQWDSARTRELAERACFQCHSNETHWAPYHQLPGIRRDVTSEVDEARSKLNFSAWDQPQDEYDDAPEKIREKEMPPARFLAFYPDRRLSDDEREELAAGLERTFAVSRPPGEGGRDDED